MTTQTGPLRGLAYDAFEHGHRRSNLDIWAKELGFDILIAHPSVRVFFRLLRAPHVIFSTLDDVPLFFFFVGFVRMVMRRRTVGIFLRPHVCFFDHHWKYKFKWLYFRLLKLFPAISSVSMIPYFINPRFSEICRDWIYDPQNWDLATSPPDIHVRSALAEKILTHANGRKIIAAIGGLNIYKGFEYFAELAASDVCDPSSHVFVACGELSEQCWEGKARIERAGGFVWPTMISDDDIWSMYGIADWVWACYPVRNDQASGIFGRASQLGVPVIVREGSFNAIQAKRMGAPHLAIPYAQPDLAATMIFEATIERKPPDLVMIEGFKAESLARLRGLI